VCLSILRGVQCRQTENGSTHPYGRTQWSGYSSWGWLILINQHVANGVSIGIKAWTATERLLCTVPSLLIFCYVSKSQNNTKRTRKCFLVFGAPLIFIFLRLANGRAICGIRFSTLTIRLFATLVFSHRTRKNHRNWSISFKVM
jgi:hypothetical protein